MKRILPALVLLVASLNCSAQWISGNRPDDGMYAFRRAAARDFHHSADDYLQYSPGAVMLIMKAFEADSRSTWGNMIVSSAFSIVLEAAFVNAAKYTVCRNRPDDSARNSFPSGHTATAFMTATLLQKEYGWKYPWVGFGGYAIASGVGFSRILNNVHWGTDVIGGALFGIASGELGCWLGSLIFKEKGYRPGFVNGPLQGERVAQDEGNDLYSRMPYELGVYFSSAARFRSRENGFSDADGKRTSLTTAGILASIPFAKHLGVCVRLGIGGKEHVASTVEQTRSYSAFYEGMAGIYADWNFFSLAFVRPHAYIGAGVGKGFAFDEPVDRLSCRAQCAAGVDLGLQITDNYAFKFIADYECSFRNWSGVMLGGAAAFCF